MFASLQAEASGMDETRQPMNCHDLLYLSYADLPRESADFARSILEAR